MNVPRKQRNQASNSDHIQFAAEITTSLLGQVRHLQAVLSERDDSLKSANADKSRLETEAKGFAQRLKHLDDSEQRYRDENWNLETQLQDLQSQHRDGVSREQKLQQTLSASHAERAAYEKELDELKNNYGKASEEHIAQRKYHETEMANLRKNLTLGDSEKNSMQRKIEELTSQNQELARGLASRLRDDEAEPNTDVGGQTDEYSIDLSEREHSPPPSPSKGGQRHSVLETETLKSSLHHAHRMIQSLKSNVHREKAEKQDFKRMLQEARDELETRRAEPNEKRSKSKSQTDAKRSVKPGLGAMRNSRTDILLDPSQDSEWEDHEGNTPQKNLGADLPVKAKRPVSTQNTDVSDAYQTANETEDSFETANERDTTDNDAFQTGTESMAGDTSEELTETEAAVTRGGTLRGRKAASTISHRPSDRLSVQSTASTSDEDERSIHTPVQGQPQRFRLKLNRRSRVVSGGLGSSAQSSAKNSPASFVNNGGEGGQSLFAELEDASGDDGDGTPSKSSINTPRSARSLSRDVGNKRSSGSLRKGHSSQPSTPGLRPSTIIYSSDTPPVPRIPTVDSGMMTEPWEPANESPSHATYSPTVSTMERIFGASPETPASKAVASQPGSRVVSDSTATFTPPRPVWDQPLNKFSGIIPGFNQSTTTTPMSTKSNASQKNDAPNMTVTDNFVPEKSIAEVAGSSQPTLRISSIQSIETTPSQKLQKTVVSDSSESPESFNKSISKSAEVASGGIFGSVFGWNRKSRAASHNQTAENELNEKAVDAPEPNVPQEKDLSQSTAVDADTQDVPVRSLAVKEPDQKRRPIYDQGSQTVLLSEQIDQMLSKKNTPLAAETHNAPIAASMKPLAEIGAVSAPTSFRESQDGTTSKVKIPETRTPEVLSYKDSTGRSVRRPTSATSVRSRIAQYPPLPPDHQEAIAAATQKGPEVMGPPSAPASAYPRSFQSRAGSRPRTPSQQGLPSPSSKGGTTPRAGRYSTTRSQVSRRSSVSSFASELDERFNIRTDGMPMPQGISPATDPRMIQAITQTMIGEMMWKYTRKAGRGEMSSTRHRRFFWVHPYTRTLYWSDRDPATANRAELKSKSVAIEAIRVVADDNPMPPGLHRKSLIIVTPGRYVKFTAQTSQRHETWFNALSYLLLRTGPDGSTANVGNGDLTDADVDEFKAGYNRRSARSRVSLASFKSNATANRNVQSSLSSRAGPPNLSAGFLPQSISPKDERPEGKSIRHRISRSFSRSRGPRVASSATISNPIPQNEEKTASTNETPHASISSRISSLWKQPPSVRNSMRSRSSMRADEERQSNIEAGVVEGGRDVLAPAGGDSAEDLRRVIEERERQGALENVRACCDGEFDLYSSLSNSLHLTFRGDAIL